MAATSSVASAQPFDTGPNWVPLGPAPIVHGATISYEPTLSPPMSGRATVLAVNPQNRYNVWLGTAGGGLWVTNNANVGGLTNGTVKPDPSVGNFDRNWQPVWFPMNDGFTSLSIGAIELDPSGCSANGCFLAYVGTGENSLRRDTYYGDGVYRVQFSNGEFPSWSWTRLDTNKQFRYGNTTALVRDGNEILVALSAGNTTTPLYATVRAPEPVAGYGVHRRDGAGNWTRIFDTPSNGKEKWGDLLLPTDLVKLSSGADSFLLGAMNDGLFRTDNRGQTWCALNPGSRLLTASQANQIDTTITDCSGGSGLPAAGTFDHVELEVGPGGSLHAILGDCPSGYTEATQGGTSLCEDASGNNRKPRVFKSSGAGTSWSSFGQIPFTAGVSEDGHYSRYTHALYALSSTQVLWGGLSPWLLETNGSLTATRLRRNSLHFDVHDFAAWGSWDQGSGVVYAATDGGFYFLPLGLSGWIAGNDSLITTAFVDLALDQEDEPGDGYPRTLALLGGLQDNSNAAFNGSPKWQLWGPVGDGGGALIQTPTITFESIQDNTIYRRPGYGTTSASVDGPVVNAQEDVSFYAALTQHEATKRIFVGTDVVSVRSSAPTAWDPAGGTGLPAAVQISPVLGTAGHDFPAIETDRDLITALAVAPSHGWRVYVGLYSGKLWRSTTGPSAQPTTAAADWTRADSGLPAGTISSIAVDPTDATKVWVAFSAFLDQTVWFSDNSGSGWVARSSGLPAKEPVKVIKVVPDEPGTLWAGTDSGVYVTKDGGVSWQSRTANLPRTPVFDLEIDYQNNRVFAATHGRGVWMHTDEGPQLTTFEGWMEDGIWDIPIYGIGFDCSRPGGCDCTVDVEREDGSVCATGTHDAMGTRIFVAQGDHLLRTEDQGSCTRCEGLPVVWACFNGKCVGPGPLSSCNAGGHRVSAVKVRCEDNPVATGSVAGFCPEQSNPPADVFEVTPGITLPGTGGGGGGSPSPPAAATPTTLLATPTILASPANGGDRALCSALVELDPVDLPQGQLDLRDAINASPSCQAVGVKASVMQEVPLVGEDTPGVRDLQVGLSAPGLEGTQMILGVAAPPGEAVGLCFNMSRLGVYLGNQVAITQMTFPTGPGGAAGGEVRVTESSPVGTCTMRIPTTAGWNGTQIAHAVAQAFKAPGVPQPRTCPEANNPRDITQDGEAVVAILPTTLRACVFDAGVGFSFGPHGIPVAWPAPGMQYAAKIVCGVQKDPDDLRLARGVYATTVNVHNPDAAPVAITKKLALSYPPPEQRPGEVKKIGSDLLGPDQALKTDCMDLRKRLFPGGFPSPYIEGFVVLQSSDPLDVTAVYTTATLGADGKAAAHSSIDVEQIPGRRLASPRPPGGGDEPDDGERSKSALLCHQVEARGEVQERLELRSQFGRHPEVPLGPMRWLCEPVFKAHQRAELPAAPPSGLPLSCYEVAGELPPTRVALTDRNGFFAGKAEVGPPRMLCDPVRKLAGAGQEDAADAVPFPAHLLGYALKAGPIAPTTVFTRGRFGAQEILFRRSMALLERATKNQRDAPLPEGQPFHCYHVEKGRSVAADLRIVDQFGEHAVRLGSPALFCDPTVKELQ